MESTTPQALVFEFGMGVDVHGQDCTKAARRAVSDAIRHSSLPLFSRIRERGGTMVVQVTVAVPGPARGGLGAVKGEVPPGGGAGGAGGGGGWVPNRETPVAGARHHGAGTGPNETP